MDVLRLLDLLIVATVVVLLLPCRTGNIIVRALMERLEEFRNWTGRESTSVQYRCTQPTIQLWKHSRARARKYAYKWITHTNEPHMYARTHALTHTHPAGFPCFFSFFLSFFLFFSLSFPFSSCTSYRICFSVSVLPKVQQQHKEIYCYFACHMTHSCIATRLASSAAYQRQKLTVSDPLGSGFSSW